jgi:hypothetical protein
VEVSRDVRQLAPGCVAGDRRAGGSMGGVAGGTPFGRVGCQRGVVLPFAAFGFSTLAVVRARDGHLLPGAATPHATVCGWLVVGQLAFPATIRPMWVPDAVTRSGRPRMYVLVERFVPCEVGRQGAGCAEEHVAMFGSDDPEHILKAGSLPRPSILPGSSGRRGFRPCDRPRRRRRRRGAHRRVRAASAAPTRHRVRRDRVR